MKGARVETGSKNFEGKPSQPGRHTLHCLADSTQVSRSASPFQNDQGSGFEACSPSSLPYDLAQICSPLRAPASSPIKPA